MRLARLVLAAAAVAVVVRVAADGRVRASVRAALADGRSWSREARAELVDDLAAARGDGQSA